MNTSGFHCRLAYIARGTVLVALLSIGCLVMPTNAATLTWTTVLDHEVPSSTNQLRAVALADDEESVYVGYIQMTGGNRRVFQHDTSSPYALLNTHLSGNDQPKGIATDDRGNVYIANRGSGTSSSFIQSFPANLSAPISSTSFTSPVIGGIAVQRIGNSYYAYTVYESDGLIERYDVTNPAAMVLDTSFGNSGQYNIPGANNLRGIEVGPDGSLYVAARNDNSVYKVSSDLNSVETHTLTRPMDVAIFGSQLYVTSYYGTESLIRSLNMSDLSFVEDITITDLDGSPYSRGSSEGWSGIDIDSTGNIWLVDQQYSGSGTNTRDRLLLGASLAGAPVPAPGTIALAGLAGVAGLAIVRRRRQQ